jgi:hypothetical protein
MISQPPLSGLLLPADLLAAGHRHLAVQALEEKGFEVLLETAIDADRREAFSAWIQETGIDTTLLATTELLIAHDLLPLSPLPQQLAEHPGCDNARTLASYHALQVELSRAGSKSVILPASAFLGSQATWSLVRALTPENEGELRRHLTARESLLTGEADATDLSRYACRARVQLIQWNGQAAIRKTFRPRAARFHQRELQVLQQLGPHCDQLPRLLDHGPDYLVTEFVPPETLLDLPRRHRLLPLPQVRALADFVRMCVCQGFDPVDMKPAGNVLYTRSGLKVVDYEFWRRCEPATPPEQSLCIAGLRPNDDGDRPWGLTFPFNPYPAKWLQHTGLSPHSLFYDPPWLQTIKRAIYLLRTAPQRAIGWMTKRPRRTDSGADRAGPTS